MQRVDYEKLKKFWARGGQLHNGQFPPEVLVNDNNAPEEKFDLHKYVADTLAAARASGQIRD